MANKMEPTPLKTGPVTVFEALNALNVNEHTEQKDTGGQVLTYLSWVWAWTEVKKRFPDANYHIWRDEKGLPYVCDPATGYMVFTDVTIGGITHNMWLSVMDGANKAMKPEPYTYTVKNPRFKYAKKQPDGRYLDSYGNEQKPTITKNVDAATMTDINKTIMRCLVKNLAMHGLGLYIYAGEDLPEGEQQPEAPTNPAAPVGDPAAMVNKQATLPLEQRVQQAISGAPAAPPPEPPKPETPAAFISRSLKEITAKNAGFDFMKTRAELIKGGVIEDIPSATMNMEQAKGLIEAIEKNLREAG